MKKTVYAFLLGLTLFAACNANTNSKNEYPADVTQNFMNSCVNSGASQEVCSCALEKIEKKYTLEEFSAIEVKVKVGQTPQDFLDFMGKIRVDCSLKK